ncbi:MAG TPA: protein phosphatase 2C domain-containing protein [Ktedonobacterales bacterium]|jgi:protein phosphatase|nr:protein phosphatase 2C domain-containing protein [Ktedonobacterales bacterium]
MDIQDPQHTPNQPTNEPDQPGASEQTDALRQSAPSAGAAETETPRTTESVEQDAMQPDGQPEAMPEAITPAVEITASPVEDSGLAETMPLPSLTPRAGAEPERNTPSAAASLDAGAPLTPGTIIGDYRIVGAVPGEPSSPRYLAEPTESAARPEETAPGLRYVVSELTSGASDQLTHIVAMNLRHPVLLAPVALARAGERLFLVSPEIADAEGVRVPSMSAGERLRPVDALRAGIELADALATLHRNNLAHLHISPAVVTLYEGRIYLSGVEEASTAENEEEARPLFARDTNFLARTMGVIGGVLDELAPDEDSSARRSLREIALRGEASAFTRAEELAESFALTLQALASVGAELGADVRSLRMAVSADAATSVGRVRAANQDAYSLAVFDIHDDAAADAPVGVFLVADGMGGEAHGEIASRLVARTVTAEMTRQFTLPTTVWPTDTVFDPAEAVESAPKLALSQALELAVKEANRRTRAFGQRLNATTGSTITALAISGARAAIAHLGDSRAYLLRDNQLLQLTEDHSLLARMEAVNHPLLEDPSFVVPRSVLYRSVGQEDNVSPDMMEFAVAPGDRVVLCSDGLWDELTPQTIGQTLADASSPRAAATDLVALANASGGNDNSTALVIFFESEPADNALLHRRMYGQSEDVERAHLDDEAQPAGEPEERPDEAPITAMEDMSSMQPPVQAE